VVLPQVGLPTDRDRSASRADIRRSAGAESEPPFTTDEVAALLNVPLNTGGWWPIKAGTSFQSCCSKVLSLHHMAIRRVISPVKIQRRWVELSLLTIRLAGFAALVFHVLPPGKGVAFLAMQLAVFGLYMGPSFAPNHIGVPLVSPKLKLDFLRRQVLMSRNISGGPPISVFMGGLNYQIEHHLFPSMARPHLRKAQPLVAAYCAAQGVPPHPHHALAVLPRRNRLPQHRRTTRKRPLPVPHGCSTPSPLARTPHPRSKPNGVAKPS